MSVWKLTQQAAALQKMKYLLVVAVKQSHLDLVVGQAYPLVVALAVLQVLVVVLLVVAYLAYLAVAVVLVQEQMLMRQLLQLDRLFDDQQLLAQLH